jgi:hypothetical protein
MLSTAAAARSAAARDTIVARSTVMGRLLYLKMTGSPVVALETT